MVAAQDEYMSFNIANITCYSPTAPLQYLRDTYAISKGYFYIISYDRKVVYKVNLSNTADVKEFTFGDALVQYIYPMYTGGIHAIFIRTVTTSQGTKQSIYLPGWIYPDGKYLYKDDEISASYEMFAYTGVEGGNLFLPYINQSAAKHGFATNYLGTICNLSSPVVKTSAQSMKVTYTLTDA